MLALVVMVMPSWPLKDQPPSTRRRTLGALTRIFPETAATAAQHGLVLVTRNVRDFAGLPVQLLDPWAAAPAA